MNAPTRSELEAACDAVSHCIDATSCSDDAGVLVHRDELHTLMRAAVSGIANRHAVLAMAAENMKAIAQARACADGRKLVVEDEAFRVLMDGVANNLAAFRLALGGGW